MAAAGVYGKPRAAVIVQTDAFPESSAFVLICQLTSEMVEAPDFRIAIDPSESNGLRAPSRIMADKPVTVRRARIGQSIGRLDEGDLGWLNAALVVRDGTCGLRFSPTRTVS